MKIQNLVFKSGKSATKISVAQIDEFVTEMITNVDISNCEAYLSYIIFLTFHLFSLLTNAFLKDETTKFSPQKWNKQSKPEASSKPPLLPTPPKTISKTQDIPKTKQQAFKTLTPTYISESRT